MIFLSFLTVNRVACVNRFHPVQPNSGVLSTGNCKEVHPERILTQALRSGASVHAPRVDCNRALIHPSGPSRSPSSNAFFERTMNLGSLFFAYAKRLRVCYASADTGSVNGDRVASISFPFVVRPKLKRVATQDLTDGEFYHTISNGIGLPGCPPGIFGTTPNLCWSISEQSARIKHMSYCPGLKRELRRLRKYLRQ